MLDHLLAAVVILGTVAYICHRVKKRRKDIRETIRILGPDERAFCDALASRKPRRLRVAHA